MASHQVWNFSFDYVVGEELTWVDMADSYEIEYGLKGYQQGIGKNIYVEGYAYISSDELEPYSDYDFYIRAQCSGEFGEWIGPNTFSTTTLNTSIENMQTQDIGVFPNLVYDVLHIKLNSTFDARNTIVSIYDLKGSLMLKSKYKDSYDLSLLPTGSYIIMFDDAKLSEELWFYKK